MESREIGCWSRACIVFSLEHSAAELRRACRYLTGKRTSWNGSCHHRRILRGICCVWRMRRWRTTDKVGKVWRREATTLSPEARTPDDLGRNCNTRHYSRRRNIPVCVRNLPRPRIDMGRNCNEPRNVPYRKRNLPVRRTNWEAGIRSAAQQKTVLSACRGSCFREFTLIVRKTIRKETVRSTFVSRVGTASQDVSSGQLPSLCSS